MINQQQKESIIWGYNGLLGTNFINVLYSEGRILCETDSLRLKKVLHAAETTKFSISRQGDTILLDELFVSAGLAVPIDSGQVFTSLPNYKYMRASN